ncbi:MAG: tRNA (adenosine(37)-N6)-dimethylallyltransferase MiaA [Acidimicrobiales bacterium]
MVPAGEVRHVALVGSTASGKSALAMELARCPAGRGRGVEIVSADSMCVYRGMDVGTAKPTATDRAEVPHHLLDLVDPSEAFSVRRFQEAAAEAIGGIEARGNVALLVGGSGLYVQAIVDGLAVPGTLPGLRAELEAEASTPEGLASMYQRLSQLDPLAASRIQPANARRVVRALEVTLGSGRPFSSFGPGLAAYPSSRFRLFGVWLPRAEVAERIRRRYVDQLGAGWLEEARSLMPLAGEGGLSRTAGQALGYRELFDHLAGRLSLEEALDAAVHRTVRFARRQRAWFRRDPRITWLASAGNPVDLAPALLGDWSR